MTAAARLLDEVRATMRQAVIDLEHLEALTTRVKLHSDDVAALADQVERLGLGSDETTGLIAAAVRRHRAAAEGLGEARFNLSIATQKVKELNTNVNDRKWGHGRQPPGTGKPPAPDQP